MIIFFRSELGQMEISDELNEIVNSEMMTIDCEVKTIPRRLTRSNPSVRSLPAQSILGRQQRQRSSVRR